MSILLIYSWKLYFICNPHECKFWYKANICNTCPIKANICNMKAKSCNTCPIKANICNMKAKSCNKVCCRNLPYLDRLLQIFAFMLQIFALFGQVLHFFPFKSWSVQHARSIKTCRLLFFLQLLWVYSTGLSTSTHTWVDIFRISLLDPLPWGALNYVKLSQAKYF